MPNPSGKKFRKLAVKAGVYHQTWINPETEDVHRQTVYITPEYLRKSAWSTMQMMKRQLEVPVCLDHQDDAYPKKTGEWLKDEMNNAVGLVSSVSYDPKTEEHVYEFEIKDPKIADKIDQGIITKVSPNFHASFSPGDGTVWNNVVGHLALTFRPKDYHQSREPMATITPDRSNQKRFSVISMDKDSIVKLVPMQKLPFSVLVSMAKKTSSGIKFSSADYDFKFPDRGAFMRWLGKRYRQTIKMSVSGKLGHTLYFAVIHAPVGGVTVNGRRYLGGQFIPNAHVEALPTEERDRVRAGSAARDKARAETAGKYIGTEEGHKEAIARHVGEHANAEMHPDDKKAAGRRWASLRGYHGDNALQQVAVLAGKEAAQLAALDPESDKAKHIKRRLRAYHEMGQMAKPPAASPMKAAASETTPKTSQEGIDQLIEKKTQEARKMIREMTPRQAVEKLKETSTLGHASWDKITKQLEGEERERIRSGTARAMELPGNKALPPIIQGINAESQKAIETGVNPPAKINNPSIPATGVSGAATNAHYMTYSGRLSDKLAEIVRENHGQPIPEGVLTPARIKARFDIGVTPEDAAAEIYHDLAKPRLEDKNAALRRSHGEQLKSAVEASKAAVDRNKHANAMKEMAEASSDADQAHEAKVAADRKQRIMDSLDDDHEHLNDEQKKDLENDIAGLKKDDQEAEDAIASKHADYADSNIREANNRERDESIRRSNEAHAEQKKKMLSDNGLMMHNGSMKIDPENLDKAENLVARMKQAQAEGEEAIKVGLDPRGNPGKRTVLTKSGIRISRNDLKKNQREIENYEKQIAYHKARAAGTVDVKDFAEKVNARTPEQEAAIKENRASNDANSGDHVTVHKLEPGLKYNAYKKHKEENPDAIHIYRMGDFYETFGDDARETAKHLNLTLTSRDKEHPMAGFPYHALESHLRSLISKGKRIAIHDGTDTDTSNAVAKGINADPPKPGSVPDAEPTPYAKEMKARAEKEAAPAQPSGFKSIDVVRKMSGYKNYDEAHADYLKHDADITEMEGKISDKAKEIDKLRDLEYSAEKKGRADLAEKYAEKRKAKSEEHSEMMDKKLSSINKKNIARTERINHDPNIPDFVKHAGNQSKGYRGVADEKLYREIEKPAIEWAKSKGYDEESAKHFADDLAQGAQLDSAESVDKWMKRAATAVENKRKSQGMLDQLKKAKGYDLLHESRQAHWHDKITSDHGDDYHFKRAMKELDEHVEKQAVETAVEKKQKEDAKAAKEKRERTLKDIGNLKVHHTDIKPEHMRDAVEHAVGSHHEPHSNFTPNKQYNMKPADYLKETFGEKSLRYSGLAAMAERGTWTDGRTMVRVPKDIQEKAKAIAATGEQARAPDTDAVFKMTEKIKKPAKVTGAYGAGTEDDMHKYVVESEDGEDHRVIPQKAHHAIMSLHPNATMHIADRYGKKDMVVYRDENGDAVGAIVPLQKKNGDANIDRPEIGEKVQLGDIAKPGPHAEGDMIEEKVHKGVVVRHPDGGARLAVSIADDGYAIDNLPGKYKNKSHAVKAARHILSFAHGTSDDGLIFKPKGDKGKQSSLLSMGVVHAPAGGADMQGHHYLGGQFTPGEGAKTENKADAPSTEEKKSFYRHADGHAKKLKLQPTIATVPGIGKVQGYKHGNMLIHKNKDRWQITHLPTGKRIGASTYKNDAIRKAYILHHGLDWNFAGEADPVHAARFKDVAKGAVPRDLNQGQLDPAGGIPGSHSDQRGLMESWIKHKPNYENAKKQYLATHGTFDENGNLKSVVANVDHWRDLIPGYNGINAPDTHPAAKHANEKFLDEMLAEMKGKGNGKVAILGGGGGSGKGTAVASHFDERDYPIRLDQTSSDYDSLMERVNKMKEHGMEPDLVFIDRRPREAWHGVVGRSANLMQKGEPPRVVPKRTAIEANINARKVAAKIAKEHPDIPLRVIDNHGGYNESRIIKDRDEIVKHLDGQDYNIDEELKEADNHVSELERKGKLPEHVAKALRGA